MWRGGGDIVQRDLNQEDMLPPLLLLLLFHGKILPHLHIQHNQSIIWHTGLSEACGNNSAELAQPAAPRVATWNNLSVVKSYVDVRYCPECYCVLSFGSIVTNKFCYKHTPRRVILPVRPGVLKLFSLLSRL